MQAADLQGAGILQLIAELAVALAGFSGVVVVMGRRGRGSWNSSDKVRLRSMLEFSFLAAFLAILPFVLFHGGLEPSETWMWSSCVGALLIAGRLVQTFPAIPARWRDPSISRALFVAVQGAQTVIALTLAANATGLGFEHTFTPYLTALVGHLALSAVMFVRLLNLEQGSGDGDAAP